MKWRKRKGKLMGGRWHKHDGCFWSISNENPISKKACGVYGEREKKRKDKRRRGKKSKQEEDQRKKNI